VSADVAVFLSFSLQAEQTPYTARLWGAGTFHQAGGGDTSAPLVRIQLLSLQALGGGQVAPRPSHTPATCFPSIISGDTNPNAAGSQLPPGLLLVCLFDSRCSKRGPVPKVKVSLTSASLEALSIAKGQKNNHPCGILNAQHWASALKCPSEGPVPPHWLQGQPRGDSFKIIPWGVNLQTRQPEPTFRIT